MADIELKQTTCWCGTPFMLPARLLDSAINAGHTIYCSTHGDQHLWNRATPSQYRMLRAIAGAVRNAAHAHRLEIPKSFARSVAKRATGTLTAQWPDVLAATANRRQEGSRDRLVSRGPRALTC
jgi:hypothetical protein